LTETPLSQAVVEQLASAAFPSALNSVKVVLSKPRKWKQLGADTSGKYWTLFDIMGSFLTGY